MFAILKEYKGIELYKVKSSQNEPLEFNYSLLERVNRLINVSLILINKGALVFSFLCCIMDLPFASPISSIAG